MLLEKSNLFIIGCCLYFLLIKEIESLTQPVKFTTFNQTVINYGKVTLFSNLAKTNINDTTTVTFTSKGFISAPQVLLSITTLKSNSDLSKCSFVVKATSKTATSFNPRYQIGSTMTITTLEIRWVAIAYAGTWKIKTDYYIKYYPFQTNTSQIALTYYFNVSSWTGGYSNMTTPLHHNKLYSFLRGISINSTAGNVKNIQHLRSIINQTYWNFTFVKPANMLISFVEFDMIAMSTNFIHNSPLMILWGGSVNSTRSGFSFTNSSILSQPFMFGGLTFFQAFNDSSTLDYQLTLSSTSTSTSMTVNNLSPVNTSRTGVNTVMTQFVAILMYRCLTINGTQYKLHLSQFVCYDVCPANSVLVPYISCAPCAYQCATCSVTKIYQQGPNCLTCSSGRTLSSGSCICTGSSNFDDGYSSLCRSCNSTFIGTLTCSFKIDPTKTQTDYKSFFAGNWSITLIPYFTSITCDTNYYLSNKLCKTCQQIFNYCLSCTNGSQCAACDTNQGAVKYTDGKCYLCTLDNCQSCSQNNYCATCVTGYDAINGSCSIQPCNVSCQCAGWIEPKINGKCSTQCGDLLIVGDEQCDDGNTINHDGCSSICKIQTCQQNCTCGGYTLPVINDQCSTICGDGIKVGSQQCDDGNTVNHDGCSSTCQIQSCSQNCSCSGYYFPLVNGTCTTVCGDGFSVGTQQCDDGNSITNDGCSPTCTNQNCDLNCDCGGWVLPKVNGVCSTTCGDGFLKGSQQCDDGNTINHDGCSSTCQIQTCSQNCSCDGYTTPVINDACSTICGDGIFAGSEECDDGNTIANDGCSSTCMDQHCDLNCDCGGWVLPKVNGVCSTLCGDGFSKGSQQCDDGNTVNFDGCSSTCQTQGCNKTCNCSGWSFPRVNGLCTTTCGDGIIAGTQQCDDANTVSHDGCSSLCQIETCSQNCSCDGYTTPVINDVCSTICGDGIVAGLQQCDDGNMIANDGCSPTCIDQKCDLNCDCGGWVLPKVNGVCSTLCGDGFSKGSQQCDDGNTVNFDGCSSTCQTQGCNKTCICEGWILPRINDLCSTYCGDGFPAGTQECDDGNNQDHDGCSATCNLQILCNVSCQCQGWTSPFVNGSCSTVCGDGVKQGIEQCDDGNVQNDDGCSSSCQIQSPQMGTITTVISSEQLGIFTVQKTQQGSLIMFLMGMRLIGLQSLWVYQSFQLILSAQSSKYQISDNIHGYSNPLQFPYRIPNMDKQLFDKFNYMFFAVLVVFGIGIIMQVMGQMFHPNNITPNINEQSSSPMMISQGPMINNRKRRYRFQQDDDDDGNDEFTVHYQKKSSSHPFRNDPLSETQAISQQISQFSNSPINQLPLLVRLSRKLLRQVLLDLLISVQPILISTTISLIITAGIESLLNFPTLVTIGSVEMFTIGLLGYLAMGKTGNKNSSEEQFWGENKTLFKQRSYLLYWILNFSERIVISFLIGVKFEYYLYCIIGVKFCVFLFSGIKQFYKQKIHNIRSVIINILHLLLLVTLTVNKVYLQPSGVINTFPSNLILIIYTTIIGVILGITLVFFLKDIWQKCISSSKNSVANSLENDVADRIFDSRRQIEQTGTTKLREKTNLPESTIFDQFKSRKFTSKNQNHISTHRSRYQHKNNRQNQYNSQQDQQDDYYNPQTTFMYNQPYEPQFQSDDILDQDPRLYRSTIYNNRRQNPLKQSRVTRPKRRQVKTARRYGKQNENKENMRQIQRKSYEQNENNVAYDDSFTVNYRPPQQTRYRLGNNQTPVSSKIKRVKTQNHANTVRNVTQPDEYMNDFDYQNDIGEVRYR